MGFIILLVLIIENNFLNHWIWRVAIAFEVIGSYGPMLLN